MEKAECPEQKVSFKKICLVVSSELTVKAFLLGHLRVLRKKYQVSVVVNTKDVTFLCPYGLEDIPVFAAPISRQISPFKDILALLSLIRIFCTQSFDLIHSVTPKAGLLAMLAGAVARIPVRIHTFTGQVWVTRKGGMRRLLMAMDRLLAWAATSLLADSFSQRDFLVENGIFSLEKSCVLANGSISGVDPERFQPRPEKRLEIRQQLAIPKEAFIFLYLGRLNRDKGIFDLAAAFALIAEENSECFLLLVGPDEDGVHDKIEGICGAAQDRVRFVDYTSTPEFYMTAADIFCLPSYREGFGSVIIEAAATGIPAIASRIYGVTDAVEEEETGLLFSPGDISQLAAAMRKILYAPEQRKMMADKAYRRARQSFSQDLVSNSLLHYYKNMLSK